MRHSKEILSMLNVNRKQADFYDTARDIRANLITRAWRWAAIQQMDLRRSIGVEQHTYDLHRRWMGDLEQKSVLDLGCASGNRLSLEIAERSRSYLGIDLATKAISTHRANLKERGLAHADARVIDFLSSDFTETFDIVYAHGVAHHFRHFEAFLQVLLGHLNPGGLVVTYDPLETSLPVKAARVVYRPFQSDKSWEWPFTKKTFDSIRRYFVIDAVQGTMGYAKWCMPLVFVNRPLALKLGRRLQKKDLRQASSVGRGLWRCMQVTMCLKEIERTD